MYIFNAQPPPLPQPPYGILKTIVTIKVYKKNILYSPESCNDVVGGGGHYDYIHPYYAPVVNVKGEY